MILPVLFQLNDFTLGKSRHTNFCRNIRDCWARKNLKWITIFQNLKENEYTNTVSWNVDAFDWTWSTCSQHKFGFRKCYMNKRYSHCIQTVRPHIKFFENNILTPNRRSPVAQSCQTIGFCWRTSSTAPYVCEREIRSCHRETKHSIGGIQCQKIYKLSTISENP